MILELKQPRAKNLRLFKRSEIIFQINHCGCRSWLRSESIGILIFVVEPAILSSPFILVVIFYLHEESNIMHENFSFLVNRKVKVPFCHKKSRPFDLHFLRP